MSGTTSLEYARERAAIRQAADVKAIADYRGVAGTLAAFESLDSIKSIAPDLREKYLLALLKRDAAIWNETIRARERLTGRGEDQILGAGQAGKLRLVAKPAEPWMPPRSAEHSAKIVRAARVARAKKAEPAKAAPMRPKSTRAESNKRRRLKRAADRAAGIAPRKRTIEESERRNAARRLARVTHASPGPVPGSTRPGIALKPMLAARSSGRHARRFVGRAG
jgi:hypothetical protein